MKKNDNPGLKEQFDRGNKVPHPRDTPLQLQQNKAISDILGILDTLPNVDSQALVVAKVREKVLLSKNKGGPKVHSTMNQAMYD